MELNLESARLAREVEQQIKAALSRLQPADRKSVLERVVVDVLAGLTPTNGASTSPKVRSTDVALKDSNDGTQTHWEKIVAYCQSLPNPAGKFRTSDVTEALLPEKLQENPAVAHSTVYTAIKRRSLGESKDPYFVWLKKGRFRLATAEERAKAKAQP
ncbi:MAG: hypothetical protein AB7P03_27635 [Kofleriaceae bacterium]